MYKLCQTLPTASLFISNYFIHTICFNVGRTWAEMLDVGYLTSFLVITFHIMITVATCFLFQYILLQPLVPLTGGKTIPYHSFHGNVTFKDVNFTYPTRPNQQILKNFSLSLPAGRMVALCGMSGGGNYHRFFHPTFLAIW